MLPIFDAQKQNLLLLGSETFDQLSNVTNTTINLSCRRRSWTQLAVVVHSIIEVCYPPQPEVTTTLIPVVVVIPRIAFRRLTLMVAVNVVDMSYQT
jgi:hypothetical protein